MSAYYASLASGNTAANNIALATFLFGSMASAGLIQTADTGQTANGSFGTSLATLYSLGYQIWQFNDTLQGTYPIFIKIELINMSNGYYGTGLAITIGTGSNGSGTITGILQARVIIGQTIMAGASLPSYCSANTNRLTCAYFFGSGSTFSNYFNIERSKDASGNDTNLGVIFQAISSYANIISYTPFSGTARAAQTGLVIPVPPGMGSLATGSNQIEAIPVIPFDIGGPVNPGNNTLIYYGPDLPTGQVVTFLSRSVNHTYMLLGVYTVSLSANWVNAAIAMIYE